MARRYNPVRAVPATFGGLAVLGILLGVVVMLALFLAAPRGAIPRGPPVARPGVEPPPAPDIPPRHVPPPEPPPQNVGPVPGAPVIPIAPAPPALHLTYSDLDDALKYVQSDKAAERRAAVTFVENAKATPAGHDKVLAAARVLFNEEAFRTSAMNIIRGWAIKEDAPVLRALLAGMAQSNSGAGGGAEPGRTVIGLLSGFGDTESSGVIAGCLKAEPLRSAAAEALLKFGADSEAALQPVAVADDRATATAALQILVKVGTEKSLLTFHRALYGKDAPTAAAAEAGLKDLGARLNLKPEQYLYVAYNHYSFEAPNDFTPDATFTKPNARQWTHTAPNRSVKSIFAVSVKLVPANYRINAEPNATPSVVGTLTFQKIEGQIDNFRQTIHYAALDGEYLVDLVLTLDRADIAAAANMTNAVKRIAVNGP